MVDPRAVEAFMKISRVALPLLLGFLGYLLFAQITSRPAWPADPQIRTDVSSKFHWAYEGPKPQVPSPYTEAERMEIAKAFSALNWIALTKDEAKK